MDLKSVWNPLKKLLKIEIYPILFHPTKLDTISLLALHLRAKGQTTKTVFDEKS